MSILKTQFSDKRLHTDVVVSSGQTVSAAADLSGTILVGIWWPATLTSTSISFQGSLDNINFFAIVNDNVALSYTVAVSGGGLQPLDIKDYYAWRYIKVVAGSTEGANRTFTLVSIPHMTNN